MNPWKAAGLGAIAGLVGWFLVLAVAGKSMRTGDLGDFGRGLWITATMHGTNMWAAYIVAALGCGAVAFAFAKSRS